MNYKHGGRHSELYNTWCGMKARCLNEKTKAYANYGGRGITVCREWIESFDQFRRDMGDRPAGLTLERVDNSKGYEPGNCVWATRSEQSRNRRSTRILEANGEKRPMAEWSAITGLSIGTIWNRINLGWSDQAAISTPLVPQRDRMRRRRAMNEIELSDPALRREEVAA